MQLEGGDCSYRLYVHGLLTRGMGQGMPNVQVNNIGKYGISLIETKEFLRLRLDL